MIVNITANVSQEVDQHPEPHCLNWHLQYYTCICLSF